VIRKIYLTIGLLLGISGMSHAADIWLSSNTATADSLKVLCGQNGALGSRGRLFSVVVSSGGSATSGITIYNSSYTATGAKFIGPIDTRSQMQLGYQVNFPAGMIYTTTGNAQTQILYQCY
jgi:hypothetical protein